MKTQYTVASQLPEFIRSDYPAFVQFLEAYYKWFQDEYSLGKIEDLVDIDNTVDDFVAYFKNQLDVYGVLHNTDDKKFLRNIKQMYEAKGSEDSFKFLFRILFGKQSSISYPWDYVFKPSAGIWQQDVSIIVTVKSGDGFTLGGNQIKITDSTGTVYKTYVTEVVARDTNQNVFELFINRFSYKNANLISFATTNGDITGDILPTTASVRVSNPGYGFQVGQVFRITSYGGTGSAIKIKAVDSNGGIVAAQLIDFGYGYESNFNMLISPTSDVATQMTGPSITLTTPTNESVYPTNDAILNQSEAGIIVRHNYSGEQYMDTSYVGRVAGTFRTQFQHSYTVPNYASLYFTIGPVCKYPGSYAKSDNVLGDIVHLQDSFYYQAFSYETTVEATIDQYGDILKQTLHPAGTKLFANFLIQNSFTVDPAADTTLISIRDTTRLYDGVAAVEDFQRTGTFIRQFYSTVTTTDSVGRTLPAKSFTDQVSSVTDTASKTPRKSVADTATATDTTPVPTKAYVRTAADSTNTSESFTKNAQFSRTATGDTTPVSDAAPTTTHTPG